MELKHVLLGLGAFFFYKKIKEANELKGGQPIVRELPANEPQTQTSSTTPAIQQVAESSGNAVFEPSPVSKVVEPGGGSAPAPTQIDLAPAPMPYPTQQSNKIGVLGPMNQVRIGPTLF